MRLKLSGLINIILNLEKVRSTQAVFDGVFPHPGSSLGAVTKGRYGKESGRRIYARQEGLVKAVWRCVIECVVGVRILCVFAIDVILTMEISKYSMRGRASEFDGLLTDAVHFVFCPHAFGNSNQTRCDKAF